MLKPLKPVSIWYDQGDKALCSTYSLAMLFSYVTGKKLATNEFLNTGKTIQRHLEGGTYGYKCHFNIEKIKTTPVPSIKSVLLSGPVVAEISIYKETDYFRDHIKVKRTISGPIAGNHRLLVLGYNAVANVVYIANTWGYNKVQTMYFDDFVGCLNRIISMNCEKLPDQIVEKEIVPHIPMKHDHFGYDYLDRITSGKSKGFHPGLDFNYGKRATDDLGLPVVAVLQGVVVLSKLDGSTKTKSGWGNIIVIAHEYQGKTIYSRYAHLKDRLCGVGDIVSQGSPIGTCGNTGASFGPHLHFDVFASKPARYTEYVYGLSKAQVQKKYLNPYEFLCL